MIRVSESATPVGAAPAGDTPMSADARAASRRHLKGHPMSAQMRTQSPGKCLGPKASSNSSAKV